jgi:hypothetical protein
MQQSSDIRVCNCGMYLRMISSWKFPTGHQRPSVDAKLEHRERLRPPWLPSSHVFVPSLPLSSPFSAMRWPHNLSRSHLHFNFQISFRVQKREKNCATARHPSSIYKHIFLKPLTKHTPNFSNPHTGTCNETCTPVPLEKNGIIFFSETRNFCREHEETSLRLGKAGTRGWCSVRHRHWSKELAALIRRRQNSRSVLIQVLRNIIWTMGPGSQV